MKQLRIWYLYSYNSFQKDLTHRLAAFLLILGKLLRIILFLTFLYFIFSQVKEVRDYSREQVIFFYLSYLLIDTITQLLFREVYRFRDLVKSGNFDFVLLKPVNPLLRVLLGGADPLDLFILIIVSATTFYYGYTNINNDTLSWFIYFLLIMNGLIISAAFHIIVLALAVIFIEVNQVIWFYRDLSAMMRLPIDFYAAPIRFLLTFILPFGIMIAFPAKFLVGFLSYPPIILSFVISAIFLFLSYKLWLKSLKKYQSASS